MIAIGPAGFMQAPKEGAKPAENGRPLSRNAQRAIAKYGKEDCIRCYQFSHREGDGTIAAMFNVTRAQANAMINAGRELAEGRK